MTRIFFLGFVLSLPVLGGCHHDELHFDVPDGGAANDRDAAELCGADAGACADAGAETTRRDSSGGSGGASGHSDDVSGSFAGSASIRFIGDPDGYPTSEGHWASWCAAHKTFPELCDTGLDEDCDGRVDEFPGLGEPCMNGCYEGQYACDTKTNSLFCQGPGGCTNELPPACGDGITGADEECDPNAPDEQPGVTCTKDCKRPAFIVCVATGVLNPEVCDDFHRCDQKLGWCVPVTNTGHIRCPKLPVEGDDSGDFYPTLETEDHECLITCSQPDQCPGVLSDCYMGFCAVTL